MTYSAALDANLMLSIAGLPDFKTPFFCVSRQVACQTVVQLFLVAVDSFVAKLVAFEAQRLVATLMLVVSTDVTQFLRSFILKKPATVLLRFCSLDIIISQQLLNAELNRVERAIKEAAWNYQVRMFTVKRV